VDECDYISWITIYSQLTWVYIYNVPLHLERTYKDSHESRGDEEMAGLMSAPSRVRATPSRFNSLQFISS
jgi:hypothetical protein